MTNHRVSSGHPKGHLGHLQKVTKPADPAPTTQPPAAAQDTFTRTTPPVSNAPTPSVIPPGMPLGNTARVGEALGRNPNNPVAPVAAAIALPLALAVDTLDILAGPPVQHSESTTVTHRGRFEITTHTSITITRGNPDTAGKGDSPNGR